MNRDTSFLRPPIVSRSIQRLEIAVDVPAVADPQHEDDQPIIPDLVDDAIGPVANPECAYHPLDLLDARRSWGVGQGINPCPKAFLDLPG